jgi:hypothetical protein
VESAVSRNNHFGFAIAINVGSRRAICVGHKFRGGVKNHQFP